MDNVIEFLPRANTSPPSARARARARVGVGNQRPWPADKVERWAIDRLIPYAKNARTHSDAQIAALAASVKEWGWTTPVLVGEDGGLIAGHARILAARQLGIAEIPVMVAAGSRRGCRHCRRRRGNCRAARPILRHGAPRKSAAPGSARRRRGCGSRSAHTRETM